MAWNENGNGKDPWRRDGDQPNDLDKIVRDWQRRFGGLVGGGKGQPGGAGGGIVLVVLVVAVWLVTGFYRIDEAEFGVEQRFGAYTETTNPGLRWHLPFPIETVTKVNANVVDDYSYKTEMLTADAQYVYIDLVVQYRRESVEAYVFNVADPDQTLQDVTESALREVVGTNELERLVTGRREDIATGTREVLQQTLDDYGAGIHVVSIALETVNYPDSVQEAVDDAQKARNDSERFQLQADAYTRDVVPKARGDARRVIEDAEAYRARVIADAEGDAARFEALLAEYQKAPQVTRDRLYLDAIEEVYSNANKVIVDSDGSGNLMYLPINELIQQGRATAASSGTDSLSRAADSQSGQTATDEELRQRDLRESRERRTRQ